MQKDLVRVHVKVASRCNRKTTFFNIGVLAIGLWREEGVGV